MYIIAAEFSLNGNKITCRAQNWREVEDLYLKNKIKKINRPKFLFVEIRVVCSNVGCHVAFQHSTNSAPVSAYISESERVIVPCT